MSLAKTAPSPWPEPNVPTTVAESVMYLPIAHDRVKQIPIHQVGEEMVDLLEINHPRLQPMSIFDPLYQNSYQGFSLTRQSCYEKLLEMLAHLPEDIGIGYFEAYRPLDKQKQYFDEKLLEVLQQIPDPEQAYLETAKSIAPFIRNIPPHATGAAIDMTLFKDDQFLDMGKFDVIFGPNDQQETFSENTTVEQRNNRLLLLQAAQAAGFANYGFEWWHYSYGDRMWAYVYQSEAARYYLAPGSDESILSIDKRGYLETVTLRE